MSKKYSSEEKGARIKPPSKKKKQTNVQRKAIKKAEKAPKGAAAKTKAFLKGGKKSKTNGGITTGPTQEQAGKPSAKKRASRMKNKSSKSVEEKRRKPTIKETSKKADSRKGDFGKKKAKTGPITASEVAQGGMNRQDRAKKGGYKATGSRNQQTAQLDDYISAMAGRTGDQYVRGAGDAGTTNPQVPMRRTPPPQAPRPQAPQPYGGGQRPQPRGYSAPGGGYGAGPRQPPHPQGRGQVPPQGPYQPQGPPVPPGWGPGMRLQDAGQGYVDNTMQAHAQIGKVFLDAARLAMQGGGRAPQQQPQNADMLRRPGDPPVQTRHMPKTTNSPQGGYQSMNRILVPGRGPNMPQQHAAWLRQKAAQAMQHLQQQQSPPPEWTLGQNK